MPIETEQVELGGSKGLRKCGNTRQELSFLRLDSKRGGVGGIVKQGLGVWDLG